MVGRGKLRTFFLLNSFERERNVQDINTIIPKDPEQSLWNHPCFNIEDHSSRTIRKKL
jgi:hypothetical protein